jgi:hypothetical protein
MSMAGAIAGETTTSEGEEDSIMSKQREQQQSVAACEAVLADLEAKAAALVERTKRTS